MSDFPVYSQIKERMERALSVQTNWGRNQVLAVLNTVLMEVADAQLKALRAEVKQASDGAQTLATDSEPVFRPR